MEPKSFFKPGTNVKARLNNEAAYITGEVVWYGDDYLILSAAIKVKSFIDLIGNFMTEKTPYENDIAISHQSIESIEFLK